MPNMKEIQIYEKPHIKKLILDSAFCVYCTVAFFGVMIFIMIKPPYYESEWIPYVLFPMFSMAVLLCSLVFVYSIHRYNFLVWKHNPAVIITDEELQCYAVFKYVHYKWEDIKAFSMNRAALSKGGSSLYLFPVIKVLDPKSILGYTTKKGTAIPYDYLEMDLRELVKVLNDKLEGRI